MSLSAARRETKHSVRTQSVVLSGLYAWAATVLYPVSLHGASLLARVVAFAALLALVSGALLGRRDTLLGRGLALYGFAGLSTASWLLLGGLVGADRLEPTRAALGAFGWVLFAFSWGAAREPRDVPEDDPHAVLGDPLSPRSELPAGASLVLSIATIGAAVPLLLAFRVSRTYHALLGHAVAIGSAVALVTVSADIATRRGRWEPVEPPSRRLTQAAVSLALVGIVLFAGAVALLAS
jgi:hypothetical protein